MHFVSICYLDPRDEDKESECRVEGDLTVAEKREVGILLWFLKQLVQHVSNRHRSIDVKHDAAECNDDDDNVENVPERLEIPELVLLDLNRNITTN